MKRSWPVHILGVLCAFFVPAAAVAQTNPVPLAAAAGAVEVGRPPSVTPADPFPNEADIPQGILDVMRSSRLKYQEGSNLIKSGDSIRARAAFDKAVDLLLHCDYDLIKTPVLNGYFQDLIHRIQEDESRYLRPPDDTEDRPEKAVVDELDKLDLFPIKVDPSLQDTVTADLADTKYDIPIVVNDKVLKAIDFWLTRGRKFFVDGLIRSGRYRDMIEQIFREESIPLDIMYLAQVESLFKTNAVSRARARGIWQFERGTAIRYGLKVNSYIDERSDPEKSTRAAARYLSDLHQMFGDWNLVLAAYNWGEGKVQKLIERSGLNDFWEMTDLRRRNFPRETKNHVPLIMASIILARNPEKYGLPKDLSPAQAYEQLAVSKPIDLRSAARILSITTEELKRLNPALRGLSTPPEYPGFELNVPLGSVQLEVTRKIAELPAVKFRPPVARVARYKVRSGDTLSGIATRHHVTVAQLERANRGISPNSLQVGKSIQIPSPLITKGATRSKTALAASKRSGSSVTSKGTKKIGVRSAVARKGAAHSRTKVAAAKAKPPSSKKPSAKEIASR